MNYNLKKLALLVVGVMLMFDTVTMAQHEGAKHHGRRQMSRSKKLNASNFIKLSAGLGMSTYYGDICEGWNCYKFRHSLNMGAYFRYNHRFSLRGDLFWTRLYNDDQIYKFHRNLGFRSDVLEFSTAVMYDIFPFEHKFERRRAIEPYIHAGIGLAYFNPMGKMDGRWYDLSQYQTEGKNYTQTTPVIPVGAGFRTRMRHDLNLGFEFSYRLTFTDYLDDVSGKNYLDPSKFPDGANSTASLLANRSTIPYFPERVRGNPNRNDGYFTFTLRAEYMIKAYPDMRRRGNLHKMYGGRKTIKRR